jgi:hypothetical protein
LKKISGIVNLLIFMVKEQVDKDCGFSLLQTKPLVRDDLLEVTMPVTGVVKNRSERKVAELNHDLMEVLKPVLGRKKTRSVFGKENLNLEINLDNFNSLKDQNEFLHPVSSLMLRNNFRIRDVNFKEIFCLLKNLLLNNLEVVVSFVENLSSKNSSESRRLNFELYIFAECLHFGPKLFNSLVNDVSIYYGEKKSSPLPSIPFDVEMLSYPFWKELELTHGVFILKVGNINKTNLLKSYYQSETKSFVKLYRVLGDCKKFSIITSLSQLFLEDLKFSFEWNYPLEYLKNKEEWIFSRAMTREKVY